MTDKSTPEAVEQELIAIWQSLREDQIIICKDGLARIRETFEDSRKRNLDELAEFDAEVEEADRPFVELSRMLPDFISRLKSVHSSGKGFSKVAGVNDLGCFLDRMRGILSAPEKVGSIGDADWDYIADIGGKIVALLVQIPRLKQFLYQKFEDRALQLKKRVGTVKDVDQTMPGFIRSYEDLTKFVNEVLGSCVREANFLRGKKLKFLEALTAEYERVRSGILKKSARTLAYHLDSVCEQLNKDLEVARSRQYSPVELAVGRALFDGNYGVLRSYSSDEVLRALEVLVGKGVDEHAALKVSLFLANHKPSQQESAEVSESVGELKEVKGTKPNAGINLPYHAPRTYSSVEIDICHALESDKWEGLGLYSPEEVGTALESLVGKGLDEVAALKVKYNMECYHASQPTVVPIIVAQTKPANENGYSARLAILETVLGDKSQAVALLDRDGLAKTSWPAFNHYISTVKKQPVRSNS